MAEAARSQSYEAFGDYVRSQRKLAQLTLRQAAELARISNPYLSQIEHGLALPSVTVLGALANALKVSADGLLMQAAGIAASDRAEPSTSTEAAIRHDPRLDNAQKQALLAVLRAFIDPGLRPKPFTAGKPASTRKTATRKPATKAAPKAARRRTPTVPPQGERF